MKNLYLKKVRWKNFLSTGEQWTTVDLDRTKVTVIIGKNGDGKSTITDAITYAMFGKALRKIVKSGLVNTKNGRGSVVEIFFNVGKNQYMVRRGIKPEIFEIYKNDDLIKQDASSRDYQSQLENIIGMNYNTFTQTVIISKTKYTPFMQLDSNQRRLFVEDILSLSIFGEMHKIQQKVIQETKSLMSSAEIQYNMDNRELEQSIINLNRIMKLVEDSKTEKLAIIEQSINNHKSAISDIKNKNSDLLKNVVEDDGTCDRYVKNKDLLDKLVKKHNEVDSMFRQVSSGNQKCKACGQNLDESHIQKHTLEYKTKLENLKTAIVDVKRKIEIDEPTYKKIIESKPYIDEINVNKKLIDNKIKEINLLEKSKGDVTIDVSKVTECENEVNINKQKVSESLKNFVDIKEKYEYDMLTLSMLKDGGIKSSIINKSIPLINHQINQNLSKFGFFLNFELDSEFNETIKHRGVDTLSYYNFSEGEKLRIDMAILLAWRDVSQLQSNVSCNVLFFDEMTDASLDVDGSSVLGDMLYELDGTNVFIITHTPEKLEGIARATIRFKKVDGYSQIYNA